MTDDKKEKIEKEVKQVGLDILIGLVIVALILGMCLGIFFAP